MQDDIEARLRGGVLYRGLTVRTDETEAMILEAADTIASLRAEVAKARIAALEEAAGAIEICGGMCIGCYDAIRVLIEKEG